MSRMSVMKREGLHCMHVLIILTPAAEGCCDEYCLQLALYTCLLTSPTLLTGMASADAYLQVTWHDHEEPNAVRLDQRSHGVSILQLAFCRDDDAAAHAERPPDVHRTVWSMGAKVSNKDCIDWTASCNSCM